MQNELTPTTPLLAILRQLETDVRRGEFAALAGTSTAYLYQLAGCNRGACRTRLAKGIADASAEMHERYGSNKITMEELAVMCPLPVTSKAMTALQQQMAELTPPAPK